MRLLLFDIDGTLIRSDGAGRATFVAALEKHFGTAGPIDDYTMSGKTDPRIIIDLMTAAGFEAKLIRERLPAVYATVTEFAREYYGRHNISAMPGVSDILAALADMAERGEVLLGLLTGNIRDTAPLKLAAAGIDPAQFRVGAYGSDHADRNRLPAVACERASALLARAITGRQALIIGDTPADILCARSGGARVMAVASGQYAPSTLVRYQPDFLFENLADTAGVLNALLSPLPNNAEAS